MKLVHGLIELGTLILGIDQILVGSISIILLVDSCIMSETQQGNYVESLY